MKSLHPEWILLVLLLAATAGTSLAQQTEDAPDRDRNSDVSSEPVTNAGGSALPESGVSLDDGSESVSSLRSLGGEQVTSLSDAELVALMRGTIAADKAYLEQLTKEQEQTPGHFQQAADAFEKTDERLTKLREKLETANRDDEQQKIESLTAEIRVLEPRHALLQERFDLAIERRRLVAKMIPLVEALIAQAEGMLRRALGEEALVPASVGLESGEEISDVPRNSPSNDENGKAITDPAEAPIAGADAASPAPPDASPAHDATAVLETNEDVARAEKAIQALQQSLANVESRLALLNQVIELEETLQSNARKEAKNVSEYRDLLMMRLQQQSPRTDNANELRQSLNDLQTIESRAKRFSRMASDRIARLNEQRGYVREAAATRRKDIEIAKQNLADTQERLARITNPFHPRNLLQWLFDHGPTLLAILVGMAVVFLLLQFVGSRIVHAIAGRGSRGSRDERLSRANTLVSTFRQAATLAVLIGGTLMILQEIGIPIGPLLGGAAVFGLAVAFGAQNLIKDFFQGFVILLENQYKLNDVISVGATSGVVERVTLRTTILRGLDGTLHFIPNGQIDTVSNMSHGWSRALIELPVPYHEDVDRVIDVVMEVCSELRQDERIGALILEDATMLGVDSFASSSMVVKFFIKTLPLQQWAVRREFLRRIKNRFDEENIELPLPHRMVYHRTTEGSVLEQAILQSLDRRREIC